MAFNKNIKHFSLTQMLKIEGDQRDFCMFFVCVFYYFFVSFGKEDMYTPGGAMDLSGGWKIQGLRVSDMDSPHVVMVPGGSSDLRFTIKFEGRTTLLPTSSQIQGMALRGMGR